MHKPDWIKRSKASGLTTYFNGLDGDGQERFAERCGTSRKNVQMIITGHSTVSNSLALKFNAHSRGAIDKYKLAFGATINMGG